MAESDFQTTKSTEWSHDKSRSSSWSKDGVSDKNFTEHEKLPLTLKGHIAALSHDGVMEKCETENGMLVAVKRMSTYGNVDTNNKLRKEVEILRSLKHYHCISLLGTYTQGDYFSIVTEPCAMGDLYTYLSEPNSRMFKDITMRYGSPKSFLPKTMGCLAHGLQYLHKEPTMQYDADEGRIVRHRVITPRNIVLDGSRVLFTDFGLLENITATQSDSSGSSAKTMMYTSPEPAGKKYRDTSCDIFSLGCVFAEMFNVYKGKTHRNFLDFRRKADPEGIGEFYKSEVMSAVFQWLGGLATEQHDGQIIGLLHNMLNIEPSHRPNAEQVWKLLTSITTQYSRLGIYFRGPCCMPLVHGDALLKFNPAVDLSQTEYGI